MWKVKSKDYVNKDKKNEVINLLVNKLKEVNEEASKEDVLKKINTLRSSFRRECKKVLNRKININFYKK